MRNLQHAARLVLFTRRNCLLCETAKTAVAAVRNNRNIEYEEIDLMTKGQEHWKDVYEFDVPVVCNSGTNLA